MQTNIGRYNDAAADLHSANRRIERDEIQHRLLSLKERIKQQHDAILSDTGVNLVPHMPHDSDVFDYFNI